MNRKVLKPLMLVLASLVFFATVSSSHATDFTFRIPLELVDTPFNLARISCGVYGTVDGKTELIGSAYKDIFDYQIKSGDYNNIVEIGVTATYGKDPNLAETYSCSLLVATPGMISFIQTNDIEKVMKADGPYPKDPSKPFRVSVGGPIPKQAAKQPNIQITRPKRRQ